MVIYLKYGELVLKGKNRKTFVNCLNKNISNVLKDFKLNIIKSYDFILINNFDQKKINNIIDILKKIPGIGKIIIGNTCKTDIKIIEKEIIKYIKLNKLNELKTFKCEVKRSFKEFKLNSMEISKLIGSKILENFKDLKVDVHKPNLSVYIEIKKNESIIYFNKINGLGGFPVGINGRILLLISGGIDSPVAAVELIKKGMIVDFLTFLTPPHTSEKLLDKVTALKKIITMNNKLYNSNLYTINFTPLMHELAHISNKSYQITLMRRYFFRIASKLAKDMKYDAIATGESLGQVASQTIESMKTIENAIDNHCIVLRPLLTLDKWEIINKAKDYCTYETSILPFADCCSLLVPENPATKPNIDTAIKLESELDLIDDLMNKSIKNITKVE